jgi:hypothetical protein
MVNTIQQTLQTFTPTEPTTKTEPIIGTWATLNIYLIQNNYTKQTDGTYKNQTGQQLQLKRIKEGQPPVRDNQSLIKQDLISLATTDTYQLTKINN